MLNRDVWQLPEPFLDRMGDLLQTSVSLDPFELVNMLELTISESEEYLLIMVLRRPIIALGEKVATQCQKGVTIKTVFGKGKNNIEYFQQRPMKNIERRIIERVPATMVLTEKSAVVALVGIDEKEDFAMFSGKDAAFLNWAKDLFGYYWERGKQF